MTGSSTNSPASRQPRVCDSAITPPTLQRPLSNRRPSSRTRPRPERSAWSGSWPASPSGEAWARNSTRPASAPSSSSGGAKEPPVDAVWTPASALSSGVRRLWRTSQRHSRAASSAGGPAAGGVAVAGSRPAGLSATETAVPGLLPPRLSEKKVRWSGSTVICRAAARWRPRATARSR